MFLVVCEVFITDTLDSFLKHLLSRFLVSRARHRAKLSHKSLLEHYFHSSIHTSESTSPKVDRILSVTTNSAPFPNIALFIAIHFPAVLLCHRHRHRVSTSLNRNHRELPATPKLLAAPAKHQIDSTYWQRHGTEPQRDVALQLRSCATTKTRSRCPKPDPRRTRPDPPSSALPT
jgi:hypothetical protein